MKINGKSYEQARPVVQKPVAQEQDQAENRAKAPGTASSAAGSARRDTVQISDAARALADSDAARGPLTPERTAELRKKVLEGAYNSMQVVDHVARRILERGDA